MEEGPSRMSRSQKSRCENGKVKALQRQKPKRNQKMKELNRKGAEREGSELDAFCDPREVSPPIPPKPATVQTDNAVAKEHVANSKEKEEERVAAKNEENTAKVLEESSKKEKGSTVIDTSAPPAKPAPQLKHTYEDDQWSPLNPEGKKKYGRDFLLELQQDPMSRKKPENLPSLDIILDSTNKPRLPESRSLTMTAKSYADFTPTYVKSPAPRLPPKRNSQQGRVKQPKVITMNLSLKEDVKLHESENAWKPRTVKKETDEEKIKSEDLYKKVRGILNKLTPQKFDVLVGQVKELPIDNQERLSGVMELVFEKALDEPSFSVAYAKMCKTLALMNVPVDGTGKECVNFRKLLLLRCQREFEKDWAEELRREERMKDVEEDKKKEMQQMLDEEERRLRKRSLGNIRFIGELYKLNMLTSKIMHECLLKLLRQGDEDSLECLCRLLNTIGREMEQEIIQKSKNSSVKEDMNVYFQQMQSIVHRRNVSSRVRFMLQDIMELRACNWISRRDENNPKTIDQIHREAQQEAIEQTISLQSAPARRADDRRKKGAPIGGGPSMGEDGWNTAGKVVSTRITGSVDFSKLTKHTLKVEADNIQLGPGGRGMGSWIKGSQLGSKQLASTTTTPDSDAKAPPSSALSSAAPTNRFLALGDPSSAASAADLRRGSSRTPPPTGGGGREGRGGGKAAGTSLMDKGKENALAAVRSLTARMAVDGSENSSGDPGKSRSQQSSREGSVVAQEEVAASTPESGTVLKGPPNQKSHDIVSKTKALLDELFTSNDYNEAITCVMEQFHSTTVVEFVTVCVSHVLERPSKSRQMLGILFRNLVRQGLLQQSQYLAGMKSIFDVAEDYTIDIPKFWEYIGEIFSPIVEDGTLSLQFVREAAQPLKEINLAGKFVAGVLCCLAREKGSKKVGEMWRISNIQWSEFVPADEVAQFIERHQMEFTVGDVPAPAPPSLSVPEIKSKLDQMLRNEDRIEHIFDWIDEKVGKRAKDPQFIRALMTAVCEYTINAQTPATLGDRLKAYTSLLQRYLDHNDKLELQSLYALQALMHKLEHPLGVLRQIFDVLYDTEVISEDAFKQWEHSTDPAEQEGKGVALKSVTQFFIWLRETEEDDEES